jgi:NADPH:quinone reductase-like Zn-dependent oxidoreductase
METMRALEATSIGEPIDVLRLMRRPVPEISASQVLVRVLASPIHQSDLHTMRGRYGIAPPFPAVLGSESVGVVEAVGAEVVGRKVGDRVVTVGVVGTWQEYVAVDGTRVVPVPDILTTSTAAQLITNPLTAWLLVTRELRLQPGEWVVQSAAGSVVGRIVIQLGRILGFKTINIVRRRVAVDKILALGGTAVICSEDEDVRSRIAELTEGAGVSKALDCVAGEVGGEIARSLAAGGSMVVYGALATHRQTDSDALVLPLFARSLIYETQTVRGWWLLRWFRQTAPSDVKEAFAELVGRVAKGDIVVPEGQPFSFEQMTDALCAAEAVGRGPKPLFTP